MKKSKLIGSLTILSGAIAAIAPISMLSSCGCTTNNVITSDMLDIRNGTCYGFKSNVDVSKYEKIIIPNGVRTIEEYAFKDAFTAVKSAKGSNNSVKELVLPSGIRYIKKSAFEGCNGIETLNLSAWNEQDIKLIGFDTTSNATGNDAFKEWKAKGKIVYGSIDDNLKKDLNNVLVQNGLSKYWTNDEEAPNVSESHIVSINDFHGAAPGFGDDFFATNQLNAGAIRLAQETQGIINRYPGSKFLSCGDYNAGESFSTCKQAETLYPVLKQMDIQYSAVGNHAWEWGNTNLENKHWDSVARTDETVGNYFINANVLKNNQYRTGKTWCIDETDPQFDIDYGIWDQYRVKWADPYKILDMNGHSVCIIGLTTQDTLTDGNLNAIADLSFIDYNASLVYAKHLAKKELQNDYNKIESFILLTHCACKPFNDDPHKIDPDGECAKLAKNATTDFDVILAAHSHFMCAGTIKNDKTQKDIWIGQAGQSGRYFTDTKLVFDDTKPVGQRLQSASLEIKTPHISGQDMTLPVAKRKPNKEQGFAQMKKIVDTTTFPIVRNVAQAYEEQKQIAKAELDVSVGNLTNEGLPYYYTDHTERSFGTQYMQSDTLVEPATVFAQKGLITEFNEEYTSSISAGDLYSSAIALNNLDSFKNGFSLNGQSSRAVTKNEVFSQNAFENSIWYGCLTVDQLKQYINYILEGATKFCYDPKVKYPNPLYKDGISGDEIEWANNEKGVFDTKESKTEVKGTSYSCGPVQFYGMSFNVKVKEKRTEESTGIEFKVYELDDTPNLKIYDAKDSTNKLDDPTTWSDAATFTAAHNNYIPVIMSSFTHQGGNAQNRMLHHWFEYNEEQEKNNPTVLKLIKSRMFSLLTRDAVIRYAQRLTSKGISMDEGINKALLDKLIVKPE